MVRAASGNLRARLVSAAVALPLLIAAVWAGNPIVLLVAIAIAFAAAREAAGLMAHMGMRPLVVTPVAGAAFVLSAWALGLGATALAFGGAAAAMLLVSPALRGPRPGLRTWLATWGPVVYAGLPLAAVVLLRGAPHGLDWLLLGLLATFATDTGAYFVGRARGRHKMAPRISPGKTWEGAAGGLAACVAATVALNALLGMAFAPAAAAALGAAIGVASQAGDLAESKLKRMAGVKDSGRFLPGHGGLLDRLDSLAPIFPLVYHVSRIWPAQ
ncbi:MAG: phosphatidate cytidylyltransferase [SAR202 cluster bacterium]|nr:phosphatidate cytidylyltransferase [SAR202 cluster bacterium]